MKTYFRRYYRDISPLLEGCESGVKRANVTTENQASALNLSLLLGLIWLILILYKVIKTQTSGVFKNLSGIMLLCRIFTQRWMKVKSRKSSTQQTIQAIMLDIFRLSVQEVIHQSFCVYCCH